MKSFLKRISSILLMAIVLLSSIGTTKVYATKVTADGAVLQISHYEIEEGTLLPATEVNLTLDIMNTGTGTAVNAVVTLVSESGMIYPIYGEGNQIFIGDLAVGETKQVNVPIKVSKYFNLDVVDVTCNFSYATAGTLITNAIQLAIPSSTGYSLDMKNIKVAENAVVDGNSLVSAKLINSTGNDITEAKLVVEGNVDASTKEIDLGTISAGTSMIKDYYVIFTEKGEQEISFTLEYTDARGNSYSVNQGTYVVHVEEDNEEEIESNTVIVWIGRGLAILLLMIVVVIVINYLRKHI